MYMYRHPLWLLWSYNSLQWVSFIRVDNPKVNITPAFIICREFNSLVFPTCVPKSDNHQSQLKVFVNSRVGQWRMGFTERCVSLCLAVIKSDWHSVKQRAGASTCVSIDIVLCVSVCKCCGSKICAFVMLKVVINNGKDFLLSFRRRLPLYSMIDHNSAI